MRNSLTERSVALILVLLISLGPTSARASIFGEENASLITLIAQGFEEIGQAATTIANLKEQLQLARDVYAGVNEFKNFDPQTFLEGQQLYWLGQVPLASDVQSFVRDVTSNGLNGGRFNARDMYNRFDTYRDAYRRQEAQKAMGGADAVAPFDARAALGVSHEAQRALSDPSTRAQLAGRPDIEAASEGLFASDAARVDPQLLALYMQRRAAAKEAEYQAFKLYSESLGASPGKAQQLAAMAAGMSAQELARIDDKLAQSVSLQQLDRQEAAIGRATERREADFLWNDLKEATDSSFKPPVRGELSWEELP